MFTDIRNIIIGIMLGTTLAYSSTAFKRVAPPEPLPCVPIEEPQL